MGMVIGAVLIPTCLIAAWCVVRRPVRNFTEDLQVDHAREQFRMRREWLEARFLSALARTDSLERTRWEDAHWHDEILWARDRQSRSFLALIGVHFDVNTFRGDFEDALPRYSTALFEFRKGQWHAEGKRLDELSPDQAVMPGCGLELVVLHPLLRRDS